MLEIFEDDDLLIFLAAQGWVPNPLHKSLWYSGRSKPPGPRTLGRYQYAVFINSFNKLEFCLLGLWHVHVHEYLQYSMMIISCFTFLQLLTVNPLLVYYKNTFIDKYMRDGNPVRPQVTDLLRNVFNLFGMRYRELFANATSDGTAFNNDTMLMLQNLFSEYCK